MFLFRASLEFDLAFFELGGVSPHMHGSLINQEVMTGLYGEFEVSWRCCFLFQRQMP